MGSERTGHVLIIFIPYTMFSPYRNLKKRSAFVCYIDARRAFDNISRDCLWYNLQTIEVKGRMLSAIQSLYQDVECAVRVNGSLTEWFKVPNGLKQGCCVSPTLFALYLNDFAEEIKDFRCGIPVGDQQISILLFADEVALIAETEENMQKMLKCLHEWCSKWRLGLNMDKTKIVHYRHESCAQSDFFFSIGETKVSMTNTYKYLGLWLEEHLNLKEMVKALSASAGRALGKLCSKFHASGGMSHKMFTKLYESLVSPILAYGAGIWGTSSYNSVNTIQNRACRFFLGLGSTASNCASRGDMGWVSPQCRQIIEVLRLYHRSENIEPHRINGIVHRYCKRLNYRSLWINRVASLLRRIGYTDIHSRIYIDRYKRFAKQHDQEVWYHSLFNDAGCENGNKLRLYRLYKDRLDTEEYVHSNHINRYQRSVLARLRSGSLPLKIETGRYNKTPLKDRTCNSCQVIEDEIHFIVDCKLYDDLRYELFNLVSRDNDDFNKMSSLVKFILIMNTEHVNILAQTVTNMFTRFKLFL